MKFICCYVSKRKFFDFINEYQNMFDVKLCEDFFMDSLSFYDLKNYTSPFDDGACIGCIDYEPNNSYVYRILCWNNLKK